MVTSPQLAPIWTAHNFFQHVFLGGRHSSPTILAHKETIPSACINHNDPLTFAIGHAQINAPFYWNHIS